MYILDEEKTMRTSEYIGYLDYALKDEKSLMIYTDKKLRGTRIYNYSFVEDENPTKTKIKILAPIGTVYITYEGESVEEKGGVKLKRDSPSENVFVERFIVEKILDRVKELEIKEGPQGIPGKRGQPGEDGKTFTYEDFTPEQLSSLKGKEGEIGPIGKSTYELAVEKGFVGTKQEWLLSLKGEKGDTGEVKRATWSQLKGSV